MKKILLTSGAALLLALAILPAFSLVQAQTDVLPGTDVTIGTVPLVIAKINQIANYIFAILLTIAVIILLYAAFLYLNAAGDEKSVDKAKSLITYVVIAVILAALAKGIVALAKFIAIS